MPNGNRLFVLFNSENKAKRIDKMDLAAIRPAFAELIGIGFKLNVNLICRSGNFLPQLRIGLNPSLGQFIQGSLCPANLEIHDYSRLLRWANTSSVEYHLSDCCRRRSSSSLIYASSGPYSAGP